MFASVRALLSGIIDYAGMFPPAKLPLDEAIRNYARYRTEPESWMLGRFICRAAQLEQLAPYIPELFQTGPPLRVSALGRAGNTVSDFKTIFAADLEMVTNFQKKHAGLATVDVFEVRLPEEILGAKNLEIQIPRISQLNIQTTKFLDSAECHTLAVFFEVTFGQGWRQTMAAITPILWQGRVMGSEGIANPGPNRPGGVKIRCGGLEASAFPSSAEIAGAITCCLERSVLLKATAGLHHPIRRSDAGVQTVMHGFINVFAAGVLTLANRLSENEVQTIIEDEDAKSFVFDDECLRWKTYCATTAQIEAARRDFITSFGSCSFDEPRADLRALGLIG